MRTVSLTATFESPTIGTHVFYDTFASPTIGTHVFYDTFQLLNRKNEREHETVALFPEKCTTLRAYRGRGPAKPLNCDTVVTFF